MGQEEYQELASFLKRFVRRFKLLQGVEAICLTAICSLLLFALGPAVQQIKNFFPYAPLVYSVITGATLLALIVWTLIQLSRRFSQEHAARFIEPLSHGVIHGVTVLSMALSAPAARSTSFGWRARRSASARWA